MRKLNGTLIVAIALLFVAASQSALARGAKSGPNLYQQAATGKHFKEVIITGRTKPNGNGKADITFGRLLDKSSPMLH